MNKIALGVLRYSQKTVKMHEIARENTIKCQIWPCAKIVLPTSCHSIMAPLYQILMKSAQGIPRYIAKKCQKYMKNSPNFGKFGPMPKLVYVHHGTILSHHCDKYEQNRLMVFGDVAKNV